MIASGYYTWTIDSAGTWRFHTSFLKVCGGGLPDQGEIQSYRGTVFEGRYQFTEAVSASFGNDGVRALGQGLIPGCGWSSTAYKTAMSIPAI